MKTQSIALIVLVSVAIVLAIAYSTSQPSSPEGLTILGALAPYQAHLTECIDQCNRSDPGKRLFSGSNTDCSVYCQAVFTEFARSGIDPKEIPITTHQSECETICDTGMKELPEYIAGRIDGKLATDMRRDCIGVCTGHRNIAEWCKKIQCPYSADYLDDNNKNVPGCMEQCVTSMSANNNQTRWVWGLR